MDFTRVVRDLVVILGTMGASHFGTYLSNLTVQNKNKESPEKNTRIARLKEEGSNKEAIERAILYDDCIPVEKLLLDLKNTAQAYEEEALSCDDREREITEDLSVNRQKESDQKTLELCIHTKNAAKEASRKLQEAMDTLLKHREVYEKCFEKIV